MSNLNQAGLIRAVDAFNSTAKGIGVFPTNALKAAISAYLECVDNSLYARQNILQQKRIDVLERIIIDALEAIDNYPEKKHPLTASEIIMRRAVSLPTTGDKK